MRTNAKNQRLLIAVSTLALLGMIAAPATAKSSKHNKQPASATSAEAKAMGSAPDAVHSSMTDQRDSRPGQAWRTVGGTVKHIKGNTYTVEDYEGNQIQLFVGQGTNQIRGHKRVGDPVRAEITRALSRIPFNDSPYLNPRTHCIPRGGVLEGLALYMPAPLLFPPVRPAVMGAW